MNNTLDIIKYISFTPQKSKVLSVISLPISHYVVVDLKSYYYNITDKKYVSALMSEEAAKWNRKCSCTIRTVFDNEYSGHWTWHGSVSNIILVSSDEEMIYQENYYLRSKHDGRKFGLMELE